MLLRMHMGFMAEELSAKLIPQLNSLPEGASVLVITRDDVLADELLFEQSVQNYNRLSSALAFRQIARTFDPTLPGVGSLSFVRQHMEKYIDFDYTNYQFQGDGVKRKLKGGNGNRAKLTIIKIGNPSSSPSDVYVQFPEMGSQPTLAVKLVNGILHGLLHWLADPRFGYTRLYAESFGAGGSMHENHLPGRITEVKAVWRIRRLIENRLFVSESGLRFLGDSSSDWQMVYRTQPGENHDLMQEAARYFLIRLAGMAYGFSMSFRRYLKEEHTEYKRVVDCEKECDRRIRQLNFAIAGALAHGECVEADGMAQEAEQIYLEKANAKTAREQIEDQMQQRLDKMVEKLSPRTFEPFVEGAILSRLDSRLRIVPELAVNKHSVSCSAGIYVDQTMKEAGNTLLGDHAGNANMEDDLAAEVEHHIRETLEQLSREFRLEQPMPFRFGCYRVACDPYLIPDTSKNAFIAWAKAGQFTVDQYREAILWAAGGFKSEDLPQSAQWTLDGIEPEAIEPAAIEPAVIGLKTNAKDGADIVIDPFWREIGTDLVTDIIDGKAFIPAVPDDIRHGLSQAFSDIRRNLLRGGAQDETFLNYIKVSLLDFLRANELLPQGDDDAPAEVWIRCVSWCGNREQSLKALAEANANDNIDTLLDRAFYVSSNIPALMARGNDRVNVAAFARVEALFDLPENEEAQQPVQEEPQFAPLQI